MKNILIAFLVLAGTARAQALNYTWKLESPISGVITDCENVKEPVALIGTVHGIVHLTRAANDSQILWESHVGPRGDARAVGLLTKNEYNLVGNTFTRLMFGTNTLESFTYINNFRIPGLYDVHYSYRVLFGDNYDTPKAYVDRLTVRCR